MADDKYKYDDSEDRDDQFDDDFGLPDLDYDELDDEDLDIDEPFDEEELEVESVKKTTVQKPVEKEPSFSSDYSDKTSGEEDDWEKELEKELEQEMQSDDDTPSFYEEESFDEYDSSSEVTPSVFGDDSDTSFKDTSFKEREKETVTPSAYANSNKGGHATPPPVVTTVDNSSAGGKGKFVRTVVIGTLVFALMAVIFWYLYPKGDTAKPVVAQTEVITQEPKEETPVETPVDQTQEPAEPVNTTSAKKTPAKPAANLPAGEITKLSGATGKAYVVIGSFFDGDLADDYARELSAQGKSPIVIPPFKDYRYYRVAIAQFESFADAQASLDSYKTEYGNDIWTLRY